MLWVLPNSSSAKVVSDLRKICNDPGLRINNAPASYAGGQYAGDGRVLYNQSVSSVGCNLVAALVNSSALIGVRGEGPAFATGDTLPNGGPEFLIDCAGICTFDKLVGASQVDIVYDMTGANGRGFYAFDSKGQHLPYPTDVVLFHELAHAFLAVTGINYSLPGGLSVNADAVALENQYRAAQGSFLGLRATHLGGTYVTIDSRKPHVKKQPGSGKCFVATAAYGTPHDDRVTFLRWFREEVLRPTRAGTAYFEHFYEHYARVSPAIVDEMEHDVRVRSLMREAVVEPLLAYLEIAVNFPDAPAGDLPEPWATFVVECRDRLEAWSTSIIRIPLELEADPVRAAAELAVMLKYVLRRTDSRERYVRALEDSGEIPLNLAAHGRELVRADLSTRHRLPDTLIARILGPEDT